ncbi:hypothetical protein AALA17_01590 [Lactobacillaceae bacterium 24-114]
MEWTKKIKSKMNLSVWGWSAFFGILIPVLAANLSFVRRAWLVGFFLLFLNTIICTWLGKYIKKQQLKWENLFVMPILYLLASWFFLPQYTIYFALFYLGVLYLSWSLTKQKQ